MSNLLYLGFFGIFVAIVIAVRVIRAERVRRSAVTILVLYILALHLALAAARRDAWPFVTHGVFLESGDEHRPFSVPRFVGVDRFGREHRMDPRSWSPIHERTLAIWWLVHFNRLTAEEKESVMTFLLHRAESARSSVGREPLRFLRAPDWYSVERLPPPSDAPFVELRVYLITRVAAQKLANGSESARLLAQFP